MITFANVEVDLHLRVKLDKEEIYQRILKALHEEFKNETQFSSDIDISIEQLNYVNDENLTIGKLI